MKKTQAHTVRAGRAVKIPHNATVTSSGAPFTRISKVLSTEDHRLYTDTLQTLTVTTPAGETTVYRFTRSSKPCFCGVSHEVSPY